MDTNPQQKRSSLREIIEQIDAAENPDLEFINLVLESARQKDAELPELVRACALPRRFDAQIIGVLRNKPEDKVRNQQLLGMICAHSFVLKRQDTNYVYHDNTRDTLLEDWRSSEEKRAQFVELNQKLATFYDGKYQVAGQNENDLAKVASLVKDQNLERYRQLTSLIQKRLVAPLLEALYHRLLAAPADGFEFFRDQFHANEATEHFTVCQSLINATRDFLHRLQLDQQDQQQFKWLDYFEVRIMRQLQPVNFEEVEKKLNMLLKSTEEESKLKLWTLNDLCNVLESQQKLLEAKPARHTLVSLAEKSVDDVWNLPLYYSNLASIYGQLGELESAAENYRTAIEKSQNRPGARGDLLVNQRLDLSGVYCEMGKWESAFETAVEALYLARTQFRTDQAIQQAVAYRFLFLLSSYDPRAADSAAIEYVSLRQFAEEPVWQLDILDQYIGVLRNNGCINYATLQLQQLRKETERSLYKQQFTQKLLFNEALIHDNYGRLVEAIDSYTRVIELSERQPDAKWSLAAALSNRGNNFIKLGRWQEAESDLRSVIQIWEDCGHRVIAAGIRVTLADLLQSRGLIAEAQFQLTGAASVLHEDTTGYVDEYHFSQGNLFFAQAQWPEAQAHFEKAQAISTKHRRFDLQVKVLRRLAQVASEQAKWSLAADYDTKAAAVNSYLATLDAYCPTKLEESANLNNVKGMQQFCTTSNLDQALDQARAFFRSASADVPGNFWYQLNLAFTCAQLEAWEEAAQALRHVLSLCPEPMRTVRLYRCLCDYSVQLAEENAQKGDYGKAAHVLHDALTELEAHLPAADLAELWLKLGDYHWLAGWFDQAEQIYLAGQKLAEEPSPVQTQLAFTIRLALIDSIQGLLTKAVAGLSHTFATFSDGSEDLIRDALKNCAQFIRTPEQFFALSELIRAVALDKINASKLRHILYDTQLTFTKDYYDSNSQNREALQPTVMPITIEIESNLAPNAEAPGIKWMLDQGFSAMRQRILQDLGVSVPGIRIRRNEVNPAGGYFHGLNEIPFSLCTVYPTERFCPDAEKCQSVGLSGYIVDSPHPAGGKGMWLVEADWPPAQAAGLPLWDVFEYMTIHTERLIREHLPLFFGSQEQRNTLDNWLKGESPFEPISGEQTTARQTLLAQALPDEAAQQRLLQVLQMLLHEQVPIKHLDTILAEFASTSALQLDTIEICERVRLALCADLPGNVKPHPILTLSSSIEQIIAEGIHRQQEKVFLALTPQRKQDFLAALREKVSGRATDALTLLVSIPELRPFVKRITELEFPGLVVMAERELVSTQERER